MKFCNPLKVRFIISVPYERIELPFAEFMHQYADLSIEIEKGVYGFYNNPAFSRSIEQLAILCPQDSKGHILRIEEKEVLAAVLDD